MLFHNPQPANQQIPFIFILDQQLVFNREDLYKRSRYFFITIKLHKKYSPRVDKLSGLSTVYFSQNYR